MADFFNQLQHIKFLHTTHFFAYCTFLALSTFFRLRTLCSTQLMLPAQDVRSHRCYIIIEHYVTQMLHHHRTLCHIDVTGNILENPRKCKSIKMAFKVLRDYRRYLIQEVNKRSGLCTQVNHPCQFFRFSCNIKSDEKSFWT